MPDPAREHRIRARVQSFRPSAASSLESPNLNVVDGVILFGIRKEGDDSRRSVFFRFHEVRRRHRFQVAKGVAD